MHGNRRANYRHRHSAVKTFKIYDHINGFYFILFFLVVYVVDGNYFTLHIIEPKPFRQSKAVKIVYKLECAVYKTHIKGGANRLLYWIW